MRTNIAGHSPYEATTGFSRAVRVGPVVHIAGTAPIAPDGSTAFPGQPFEQAQVCLKIILEALSKAGGKPEDIVRTRIYLTDSRHAEDVSRAHGEVFSSIRPAATMVVTGLLRDDWTVEIEAEAILSD